LHIHMRRDTQNVRGPPGRGIGGLESNFFGVYVIIYMDAWSY